MKLLLTNDDGVKAAGILALVEILASKHEVYVVAPNRERSSTSHSITVFEPIKVKEVVLPSVVSAWAVTGTPVDCVKLGLEELVGPDIDYVISGINHGPNLGTDVFYSGTVSAAAESVLSGCPALAVSLNNFSPAVTDFGFSANFILNFLNNLGPQGLEKHTLLNINIPMTEENACQGIMVTKLGVRKYINPFEARKDPRGQTYYWLGGRPSDEPQEANSDIYAIKSNHISISPLKMDMTDYQLMEHYRNLFSKPQQT